MAHVIKKHISDENYTVIDNDSDGDFHDRNRRKKRIGVIGAGFSGLTAAAELTRLGERFRCKMLFITCSYMFKLVIV